LTAEEGIDPHALVELLEVYLLGDVPTLTSAEVAERTGVPQELARARWRSLGFTQVPDDEVAFTEADVHAMELVQRLRALGLADEENEAALIRTVGRGFARLAELQLTLLARTIDLESMSLEEAGALMGEVGPPLEEIMNYVWRRHMMSAASRMLLAPGATDDEGVHMVVGFADIVGYTRQSRSLRQHELEELVEAFEASTQAVVTEHRGRIIKTIGDEILFVADDPADGATIALELTELADDVEDFPELRVGLAYGPVLARLGDVFGPVVNVASRLTSTARPGRVVVDRGLADALQEDVSFRLRRMRRTAVKGYRRLEPWSLKRSSSQDPGPETAGVADPASSSAGEHGRHLVRAVDERKTRRERPPVRKRAE
jgi:adenylate cyclase